MGKGYRFVASKPLDRTIDFNYLQREVPEGYEQDLQLYFSPDEGGTWTRLNTRLDMKENQATASAEQSGIYVLAASLDIPLVATGWNLFGYPVPETRPVSEALRSIAGHYTTVVGFDPEDAGDPWKIYDSAAPAFANDLRELRYGDGYWINVSEPITLQLKVASEVNPATPSLSSSLPQNGKQGALESTHAAGAVLRLRAGRSGGAISGGGDRHSHHRWHPVRARANAQRTERQPAIYRQGVVIRGDRGLWCSGARGGVPGRIPEDDDDRAVGQRPAAGAGPQIADRAEGVAPGWAATPFAQTFRAFQAANSSRLNETSSSNVRRTASSWTQATCSWRMA